MVPMAPVTKDPAYIIRSMAPFNGGPRLDRLVEQFITPRPLFFVRNHGTIPIVDATRHRLRVLGEVERPLELTIDDLRRSFPVRSVTVTLQCAGNRRQELAEIRPVPGELPWGPEAIGTAVWTGVSLADVLADAGIKPGAGHVEFCGSDAVQRGGREIGYGGSIPIARAAGSEVLLAWEMNGEPLASEHGYPLRVVVPGVIGARSVKWLESIHVRRTESLHYFQQHAYKVFPSSVLAETADWEAADPLEELPVNSVICRFEGGVACGYAVSGAAPIAEVLVTADGGRSWTRADLEGREPWAWTLWEARIGRTDPEMELIVRATDARGQTQPESMDGLWNFKGYLNNAWHRLRIPARS
jgi:sulfite oxidase